jgi:hypothetical protein
MSRVALVVVALTALSLAACGEQKPATPAAAPAASGAQADAAAKAKVAETDAKEKEALAAGVEAVVYGLPVVIMDLTRAKSTNVAGPAAFAAPVNQFAHVREFPDASFRDVVRANVDTLYSAAWLDLAKEPIVLSVPDSKGRFYLMPMLDAWTNVFASPGKRTTGTRAGSFAITGPGWTGTLPKGVTELRSPTNMVWLIGRTQTNGPKDYAAVHALQDQFKLVPLSSFGKRYTPPAGIVDTAMNMKAAPVEVLKAMTTEQFFDRLAALLKSNPPPASEAAVLGKLAKIGIIPGEKFDAAKLDPAVAKGLQPAVKVALEKLAAGSKESGKGVNGWHVPPPNLANFGADYGTRAVVALIGLGANLPHDAVYPSTFVDADGKPFDGASKYVIRFEKGAMPPVNAFWSVTLYDENSFFVANPINRYAISSWMPLAKNADGSIDLYVQHASPGKDRERNWLPAPAKSFNLTMRMYWPTEKAPTILDGSWKPPVVRRAS